MSDHNRAMTRRAVFLDRDGVLIENPPNYVQRESDIEYFDSAYEACRMLAEAGFVQVVVTNQSLVGRGMMALEEIQRLNQLVIDQFNSQGAKIVGSYLCPHAPEDECDCRKPKPGNLLKASEELGIELVGSYMVGDAVTDVQAAIAAVVTPILVRTGRGTVQENLLYETPGVDAQVEDDLLGAARWILERERVGGSG